MSFTGFTPDGLQLLSTLPTYDRDAFRRASDAYRADLSDPAKAFVTELGEALQGAISEGIRFGARTNESIAPINNDLRFNPDAPRYKDHLLFRFWEGEDRRTAPTLYVRVAADEAGFGVGAPFPNELIGGIRSSIDTDGDALARAIDRLVRYQKADVVGEALKRVPAPYPPDHPHADLLRHKSLHVRWRAHPKGAISKPRFVSFCRGQLEKASDVHRWLVEHAS